MKTTLYITLVVLLLACKKEFKQPDLVGKWKFNKVIHEPLTVPMILRSEFAFIPEWTTAEYGDVQLEITGESRFIFSSKKGTQKFRVIGAEEIPANFKVQYQNYQAVSENAKGYKYKLRASDGNIFIFHFYYEPITDRIITVPWVKNLNYDYKDRPYMIYEDRRILGGVYSFEGIYDATYQLLADFNRVN